MNTVELTAVLGLSSLGAGFLGALTGLGGGVVIVPLLTLAFGVDLRYAIGASLVSVIATSSGAAAAYVKEGFVNLRAGMLLQVATTIGALTGAWLATRSPTHAIAIVFGVVLLLSALLSFRREAIQELTAPQKADPLAVRLRLDSSYPEHGEDRPYHVRRVPLGFALMFGAGVLSALLGIGSGAVKVLAMDRAMQLPFRVSSTTSNFMIGVTAAASAGFYLRSGYIDPGLAMPVMLGVVGGAYLGSRILPHAPIPLLRQVFNIVIVALGLEMLYQGITGGI